jgi:iron complex outermembrane receptor protein
MNRHIAVAGASALLAGVLSSIFVPTVLAATGASELEEVVVTAERRTENLQNVPVTVTAVSVDMLESSHVNNIQQLASLVPSLSVVDPTGYTMAFIRGIGSSTLGGGTFSSVAMYLDGVYIARTTSTMFELDSAESVQVLAGPQGSLYGRNATAGAIVVTSKKPKPGAPLSGSLSAGFGSYSQSDFSASLSGGLGDRFALGFTAAKHDHNGFVRNLNTAGSPHQENLDDRNAVSASATLVFQASDRVSFSLRGSYAQSLDHSGGGYEAVGQNVSGPFGGFGHGLNDNRSVFYAAIFGGFCANPAVPAACPFGAATTDAIALQAATSAVFSNRFGSTYDNQRNGFDNGLLFGSQKKGSALYIRNNLLVFNANFDFDNFSLKSSTGFTNSDYHGSVQVGLEKTGSVQSALLGSILLPPGAGPYVFDAAGGLGFSSTNPSKVFLQGFQLLSNDSAHIKWIGGADYSKEDAKVDQTGDGFGASNIGTHDTFTVTSGAVYAQATLPLGASYSATLGGRYTSEEYKVVDLRGLFPVEKLKGNKFTYTARLERRVNDWLAYGGISTGFKSGTLNAATAGAGKALPEEVQQFEIGMKRDFTSRFRFNAAAYFSTYKNVQLNVIDQFTGGNILDNGPKAEVKGIDLQADTKLTQNLQMSLGATLLDAKFTENNANLPNIKGNRLPGSAKAAVSWISDYAMPLAAGGSLDLTSTVVYNSGKFYDHLNIVGSGGATAASYSVVNLNLAYKPANNFLTVSVYGNNVFNEHYYRTGIVAFGTFGREAIAGNPANFGATVKVTF